MATQKAAPLNIRTRVEEKALLTIEEAGAELVAFIGNLADRLAPDAQEFFQEIGRSFNSLEDEIQEFLRRKMDTPDSPSNVKEVISDLSAPQKATDHADSLVDLPPGSA